MGRNGSRHEIAPKQHWLDRAKTTYRFHISKLKTNSRWTITDTANVLQRSIGSISEDLLIVSWLKTHETKLKTFKYAKDALAFIREKKKRMMVESFLD